MMTWKGEQIEFPFERFTQDPTDPELSEMVLAWSDSNREDLFKSGQEMRPCGLQLAWAEYLHNENPNLPLCWCNHIAASMMLQADRKSVV